MHCSSILTPWIRKFMYKWFQTQYFFGLLNSKKIHRFWKKFTKPHSLTYSFSNQEKGEYIDRNHWDSSRHKGKLTLNKNASLRALWLVCNLRHRHLYLPSQVWNHLWLQVVHWLCCKYPKRIYSKTLTPFVPKKLSHFPF